MLRIEGLSVCYGGAAVLRHVDADFNAAALTALIGPNGSGKSSLMKALAGLLPHTGAVFLNGSGIPRVRRGECITYMPQDTAPTSSLTVLEVILLAKLGSLSLTIPRGLIDRAEEELDRFDLIGLAGRRLDQVSGGQRQLIFLAQALFREPQVLLLDEPTSALDLRHQLIVLERVTERARQSGIVVVAAIHDLNLAAQFADDVLCLGNGAVDGYGAPSAVLTSDRLKRLIGVDADVLPDANGRIRIAARRAIPSSG